MGNCRDWYIEANGGSNDRTSMKKIMPTEDAPEPESLRTGLPFSLACGKPMATEGGWGLEKTVFARC